MKGSNCSKNGSKYEKIIIEILSGRKLKNKEILFCDKNAGSSSKNDIICTYDNQIFGIEVKSYNSPDWMQCCIEYEDGKWVGSKKSKIPNESKLLFESILEDKIIFGNMEPIFKQKKLTYTEWRNIKKNTKIWNDTYIDVPKNTINELYSKKNCKYIQINKGYGLYHLENDICAFGTPLLEIDCKIRIRVKVHTKEDKNGFCKLSITASCMPKNIKKISKSHLSLDNIKLLPENLIINNYDF